MKNLAQAFVAIIVSIGFAGSIVGVPTAAAADCTSIVITNTGQGSNNQGVCTVVRNVTVTCVNNTYILNQNDQTAVTGDASTLGNTTSGTTITGDATNTNGSNVQIGSACGQTTTPDTPTTPTTPTTPASTTPTPTPAEVKKVAALPNTATSSWGEIALISVIAATIVFAATRIGTAIYRRNTLK